MSTQAGRLLSPFGKRIYFPKGLITQAQEAAERAYKIDASVGMAYSGGEPFALQSVKKHLPLLTNAEAVAYAPTSGIQALRVAWKSEISHKNPSIDIESVSVPVAVPGLTAGICFTADLFVSEGDSVVIPDMNWPNYKLIFDERKGAKLVPFVTFADGGFNVQGFEDALMAAGRERGKVAFVLNFPNNPTGYSPTMAEAARLADSVRRVAESGIAVLAIADDAYFGLQYEADLYPESIFSVFHDLHENVLAVKVDGATKEDCVWGFRSAFITFAGALMTQHHYGAIVKKLMGAIRCSISNSPAPTQYIMLKAMKDPSYESEKAAFRAMMNERYDEVRRVLSLTATPLLRPLPFNSGYFMCFECKGVSAEALRLALLDKHGIGVIALGESHLRVAFSAVEKSEIHNLFMIIMDVAESL